MKFSELKWGDRILACHPTDPNLSEAFDLKPCNESDVAWIAWRFAKLRDDGCKFFRVQPDSLGIAGFICPMGNL